MEEPVSTNHNCIKQNHSFANVYFAIKSVITHPSEDKFLILKRCKTDTFRADTWDLPGGSVDFGELHQPALAREIKEETNLEIQDIQTVYLSTAFIKEQSKYLIVAGFVCQALTDTVTISNEHSAFQWISYQDFLQLYPTYTFISNRPFDIHRIDFIYDIAHLALSQNFQHKV